MCYLKRGARGEGDGADKSLERRDPVGGDELGRESAGGVLVEENRLKVADGPGVPGPVPAAVVLGGGAVVLQDGGDARLLQPLDRLLPAA